MGGLKTFAMFVDSIKAEYVDKLRQDKNFIVLLKVPHGCFMEPGFEDVLPSLTLEGIGPSLKNVVTSLRWCLKA